MQTTVYTWNGCSKTVQRYIQRSKLQLQTNEVQPIAMDTTEEEIRSHHAGGKLGHWKVQDVVIRKRGGTGGLSYKPRTRSSPRRHCCHCCGDHFSPQPTMTIGSYTGSATYSPCSSIHCRTMYKEGERKRVRECGSVWWCVQHGWPM